MGTPNDRRTPAQRHLAKKLAAMAAASAGPGGETRGSAYELMLAQLAAHRVQLKDIQSTERKIEAKRAFLPLYDEWVDGVLQAGQGAHDLILTTVMVWHIDAGNYARAWQVAQYVLQHNLALPDQYERNLPTVLIDEFATAALTGKMAPEYAKAILPEVQNATATLDAPDQARAKLLKAIAYALIGRTAQNVADFSAVERDAGHAALVYMERALELYDQVGVKKDIERLARFLNKEATPAA